MKINAQTPFEVLEDGKARFFVGGEWSAPIDLPEFLKLPNFLRLKEWEFDTDTGKIRVYQGERQWSTPFDPPAGGGAGGTEIDLSGSLAAGLSVHPLIGSYCIKVGRVVTISIGLWANQGADVTGPFITLPQEARPAASSFLLRTPAGQTAVSAIGANPDGTVGTGGTITNGSTVVLYGTIITP